jgi:hypothetical protein
MARREKSEKKYGIPGERYVVELRGNLYYILDALNGGIMGGPFSNRDQAQRRSDQLNLTVTRR